MFENTSLGGGGGGSGGILLFLLELLASLLEAFRGSLILKAANSTHCPLFASSLALEGGCRLW